MAKGVTGGRFRNLHGWQRLLYRVVLTLIPLAGMVYLLEIPSYAGIVIFRQQYEGLFLALVLAAVFLAVPGGWGQKDRVPGIDLLLAFAAFAAGMNIALRYPVISETISVLSWDRVLLGGVMIVLSLEATRRVIGSFLIVTAVVFMLYARFAYLFPGGLVGTGETWSQLASYLYLDTGAILGEPTAVISGMVLVFVAFGQSLFQLGGGTFFTQLSLATFGRTTGGPAKVSVVASGLFGMVSGSTVANVVTTGTITIPLMKQVGYPPFMAGAIETVSSNGGQLVPPILGASAFLMADFLSVPYAKIAISAVLIAVLYYMCLYVMVHLEATKRGLRGMTAPVPALRTIFARGGVFLLPLAFLVYFMFVLHFRAEKAGMLAILITLGMSFFSGYGRISWRGFMQLLEGTGKGMLEMGVVGAAAGIVIGSLAISGLGVTLSFLLVDASGGHLAALLVITAIACIVFGMGLPTVAIYVVLVVVVAPALTNFGVAPLAAHFFIFYFGLTAHVTPPVAVPAYVAAGMAGADPLKTAVQAMKFSVLLYIVPFLLVYSPELLLQGSLPDILVVGALTALGLLCLVVAMSGAMFRPLGVIKRIIFALIGCVLLVPVAAHSLGQLAWLTLLGGGAVIAFLGAWERRSYRQSQVQAKAE